MTAERKQKQRVKPSPGRQPQSFQDQELARMLVSGEEIILRARLHGAIYWKSVAVLVLGLVVGIFLAPVLGIMFGIFGAVMLCVAILTQHYLLLAVTNKRILARYGLLQMDVVDIRLSKVESIDLERMLTGHLFGYASVVVMGTGQRVIRVPFIANADAFRRYYNEMVLAEEGNEEAEEQIRADKEEQENTEARQGQAKGKGKV
ncbi:MAG: PH domain-containing protein [Alphaproteobacteria bacterium]